VTGQVPGDPVRAFLGEAELAEEGRTRGVMDFTAAWSYDGRGDDASQRNVELWIPT
jgi:hypothetical protein